MRYTVAHYQNYKWCKSDRLGTPLKNVVAWKPFKEFEGWGDK